MSSPAEFDLSGPRGEMEPLLKSKRRVGLAVVVFAVALSACLVAVSVRPLESHTLPSELLAALIIIVGSLLSGAAMLFPARAGFQSGALKLVLDSTGFTLLYSTVASARVNWSDPALGFDLIDMGRVDPAIRLVSTPFSVSVGGVRSLLTPAAYHTIAGEVRRRGLQERLSSGSPLLYSPTTGPLVI